MTLCIPWRIGYHSTWTLDTTRTSLIFDQLKTVHLFEICEAAPVNLTLLPWCRLETHRGVRLPASPPGRHVGLQDRVAAAMARAFSSRCSTKQFFGPSDILQSTYSVYASSLDARRARSLGRMASGDLRYRRTVFRATLRSSAIPRMERPVPFIS